MRQASHCAKWLTLPFPRHENPPSHKTANFKAHSLGELGKRRNRNAYFKNRLTRPRSFTHGRRCLCSIHLANYTIWCNQLNHRSATEHPTIHQRKANKPFSHEQQHHTPTAIQHNEQQHHRAVTAHARTLRAEPDTAQLHRARFYQSTTMGWHQSRNHDATHDQCAKRNTKSSKRYSAQHQPKQHWHISYTPLIPAGMVK